MKITHDVSVQREGAEINIETQHPFSRVTAKLVPSEARDVASALLGVADQIEGISK